MSACFKIKELRHFIQHPLIQYCLAALMLEGIAGGIGFLFHPAFMVFLGSISIYLLLVFACFFIE